MIKISSTNGEIKIEGLLSPKEIEKIDCICNRWQNLFELGLPHHRKKRLKLAEAGVVFEKWKDCPRIRIVYSFKEADNALIIRSNPSNTEKKDVKILEKANSDWIKKVIETIEKEFNN